MEKDIYISALALTASPKIMEPTILRRSPSMLPSCIEHLLSACSVPLTEAIMSDFKQTCPLSTPWLFTTTLFVFGIHIVAECVPIQYGAVLVFVLFTYEQQIESDAQCSASVPWMVSVIGFLFRDRLQNLGHGCMCSVSRAEKASCVVFAILPLVTSFWPIPDKLTVNGHNRSTRDIKKPR